jgi:hypothetical protein
MDERRRAKRYYTEDYFKRKKIGRMRLFFSVFSRVSDLPIGHVVDISSIGMLIITREQIEKGTSLNLRIDLPDNVSGVESMSISARCIRQDKSENGDYFYTGFEFVNMTPRYVEALQAIFEADPTPVGVNSTRIYITDEQ